MIETHCKIWLMILGLGDKTVSVFIDGTPLMVTIDKIFSITLDKM